MAQQPTEYTVAEYLAARLYEMRIGHLFTVPGNHTADFLNAVHRLGRITVIGTANEMEAGYAADAYSRLQGFGAACVTYGVGAFSLLNAIAGSYVERCGVVLINGGPTQKAIEEEVSRGILCLHSTGRLRADFDVFSNVTEAAQIISGASDAPHLVDGILQVCMTKRRPVYLEVSENIWNQPCSPPRDSLSADKPFTNPAVLEEAVEDAITKIESARQPLIWGGEEIHRFELQDDFEALVKTSGLPYTTTLLGKAIISEDNQQFVGVYDGKYAPAETRAIVESADCVLALGTTISDFIGDIIGRDFPRMILVAANGLRIGYHTYSDVALGDFLRSLIQRLNDRKFRAPPPIPKFEIRRPKTLWAETDDVNVASNSLEITFDTFFRRMSRYIDETMVVMADTSLCLFPSADLVIKRRSGYIAQAVWLSIGYTVGAAVGASFAHPDETVVVFAGDGGFQNLSQPLSTLARYSRRAIVFLLNNGIYGIEQFLVDSSFFLRPEVPPEFFNDLPEWNYNTLATSLGFVDVHRAATLGELDYVLGKIGRRPTRPVFVEVVLPQKDLPSGVRASLSHPISE